MSSSPNSYFPTPFPGELVPLKGLLIFFPGAPGSPFPFPPLEQNVEVAAYGQTGTNCDAFKE